MTEHDFNTRHYLIMWDELGLDSICDITSIEEQNVLAVLSEGKQIKPTEMLQSFLLRARFNGHRNYEVYSIRIEDSISANDIKQFFTDNPKAITELIKQRGVDLLR